MKEAFEKIVERLEEELKLAFEDKERYVKGNSNTFQYAKAVGYENAIRVAIEIVNQVAEECNKEHNKEHNKEYNTDAPDINVDSNNGWIPVKDGLPKRKGTYLCQCRGFFRICGFAKNLEKVDKYDFAGERHAGFYDFDAEYGYCEVGSVLAWRELPPEYKEYKDCDNCANNTDWDEVDRGCYMCCKGLENNYQPKGE